MPIRRKLCIKMLQNNLVTAKLFSSVGNALDQSQETVDNDTADRTPVTLLLTMGTSLWPELLFMFLQTVKHLKIMDLSCTLSS